jgi:hypothetical protein
MRPYKTQTKEIILTTTFQTPLGEMFAAATKKGIVILCFFTPYNIEAKLETLKKTLDADVIPGNNQILDILKIQLNEYSGTGYDYGAEGSGEDYLPEQ